MNAQSTIESSNTPSASSGDQDDPGSCPGTSAPTACGSDNQPRKSCQPVGDMLDVITLVDGCGAANRGIDIDWIARNVRAAVHHLDRVFARITVRLIGDDAMTRMHHAHCGLESTTDVLTFDATEAGSDMPIEVDIAVCVDEGARAAVAHHHSTEHELLLYTLHGVLHCIGFDDHDDAHFATMHAQEDRLLELIGVGHVFDPGGRTNTEEHGG